MSLTYTEIQAITEDYFKLDGRQVTDIYFNKLLYEAFYGPEEGPLRAALGWRTDSCPAGIRRRAGRFLRPRRNDLFGRQRRRQLCVFFMEKRLWKRHHL